MRIAAVVAIFYLASVAAAADTVIAKKRAVLRRDKNAMSPVVAQVAKGQQRSVLNRDAKWIFSESQGKQGWAAESWLKEDSSMGKDAANLNNLLTGNAQASAAGEAAAASGV